MIKIVSLIYIAYLSLIFSQVNVEAQRNYMEKLGKNQSINFNWNLSSGNSDYSIANLNYRFDDRTEQLHKFLTMSLTQGNEDGDTIKDKGFVHLRHVFELNPLRSLEIFLQLEYDKFIDLELRKLLGAGFRVNHIKNSRWILYTGHSVMVETEHYSNHNVTNIIRLSEYISFTYKATTSSISLVTYLQPNIGDIEDIRMLSDLTWDIPLSKQLSLQLSLSSRFDNEPEFELDSWDIETKTGLRYLF